MIILYGSSAFSIIPEEIAGPKIWDVKSYEEFILQEIASGKNKKGVY
ncbi:MAG: hypothetical protein R2728_00355 [Chitinophagales bacterium]